MKPDFDKIYPSITVDGVIPPNNVLGGAKDQLHEIVIVGKDKAGQLYVASSHPLGNAFNLIKQGLDNIKERME